LLDSTIEHAINKIGILGLHEGIISGHVMFYTNYYQAILFSGIINRPALNPSKKFTIEPVDKAEQFLKIFRDLGEEKNFKTLVLNT